MSYTAALLSVSAANSSLPDTQGYELVWADEFDVEGKPDPEKWTYEHGFVRNEEAQWYQPENAFCTNGLLVIEGRKERKANPNYKTGSTHWRRNRPNIEYTSACVVTRGLHSWRFGLFEVRARIKPETGLWPAIWFLGEAGRWPYCGEIDLMEYYDDSILANACWGAGMQREVQWNSVKKSMASFRDPEWGDRFHVWRMLWTEEKIELYVDDLLLNTITLRDATNPKNGLWPEKPFHQPHYLLLNLAMGGDRGGDVTQAGFPSRFEIDYVRVYQKPDPSPSSLEDEKLASSVVDQGGENNSR